MARTYVLDTNVLIADPEAPGRFQEHDVAIPLTVVAELDKLKTRPDETAASDRRALPTPSAPPPAGQAVPGGGAARRRPHLGRGQPGLPPGPARGPLGLLR